jgi:hypothetical protein
MGRRWRWIAVGCLVVVAEALALALTRGNSTSNNFYADLWSATHVDQAEEASVVARWPRNPYQHYRDNLMEDCYEWEDQPSGPYKDLPAHMYNLCFKGGVLRLKTVF